jgi:hypothetical protein
MHLATQQKQLKLVAVLYLIFFTVALFGCCAADVIEFCDIM